MVVWCGQNNVNSLKIASNQIYVCREVELFEITLNI